jgi:hypothetical protein
MKIRISLLMFLFTAAIVNTAFSQNDIKDYEYTCYCTLIGANPRDIIETGNNWDLLLALKDGKTLDELDKSGMKYSKKQLGVLQALNFIKKTDDKYYTSISILNANETAELRTLTKDIAGKIILQIHNDYILFARMMQQYGFENNTYSVMFSYVLDNLVWQKLEAANAIPIQKISVERPVWDGTLWFTQPKRAFECGTNIVSLDNMNFGINWSDDSGVSLGEFGEGDFDAILKNYKNNAIITDSSVKKMMLNYGLCTPGGKLKFPVIKQDSTDKVNVYSQNMANTITDFMVKNIDFSGILSKYHIKSKADATVILYHEIIFDLLDILEENKLIKKPVAFAQPQNSKPTDAKDLVFIFEE